MENGGAWPSTRIVPPGHGFREFIGGSSFGINSWPPLPATLIVEDSQNPVTRGLPKNFVAPTDEWYSWRPSPRLDPNVRVLLTLDAAQYPLGIKGLITSKDPDVPVVWTNIRFKMLYVNMGHGRQDFRQPRSKQTL